MANLNYVDIVKVFMKDFDDNMIEMSKQKLEGNKFDNFILVNEYITTCLKLGIKLTKDFKQFEDKEKVNDITNLIKILFDYDYSFGICLLYESLVFNDYNSLKTRYDYVAERYDQHAIDFCNQKPISDNELNNITEKMYWSSTLYRITDGNQFERKRINKELTATYCDSIVDSIIDSFETRLNLIPKFNEYLLKQKEIETI